METHLRELVDALTELTDFLNQYGEHNWSARIQDDLYFLRKGDTYGAERFLTYFGGMGSLNDLYFCAENGHILAQNREETNKQFEELTGRAHRLAQGAIADGVDNALD